MLWCRSALSDKRRCCGAPLAAQRAGQGRQAEPQLPGAGQASAWEQTAVLSEGQERAIELLSEHCAQRPVPEHVGALPLATTWLPATCICPGPQRLLVHRRVHVI